MPLRKRPHTLWVVPVVESIVNGVVNTLDKTAPAVAVPGQIWPLNFEELAKDFGIECSEPHMFIFNIEDGPNVKLGYIGVHNNHNYVVVSNTREMDAAYSTNHYAVALSRLPDSNVNING